jgi:hypothetical protein
MTGALINTAFRIREELEDKVPVATRQGAEAIAPIDSTSALYAALSATAFALSAHRE